MTQFEKEISSTEIYSVLIKFMVVFVAFIIASYINAQEGIVY